MVHLAFDATQNARLGTVGVQTCRHNWQVNTTILIVDDSESTRRHLERVLLNVGLAHVVLLAANGGEALRLMNAHDVSLILCDIEMPHIGGLQFLRILQAIPDHASVPVLLLTVRPDVQSKITGLTDGAVDYLTKPFNERELVARVRVHLRLKGLQDDLRAKNAKLEAQSKTDFLTGLSNRRHLMQILEAEFARVQRHGGAMSFVLADLDHFKSTNDAFGHQVGDRCLQLVADTLSAQLRKCDLAARFGGEEFAILLPETEAAGASVVAERFRKAVAAARLVVEGRRVPITASLGVSTCPSSGIHDVAGLIKAADQALYAAKGSGRNRVCA